MKNIAQVAIISDLIKKQQCIIQAQTKRLPSKVVLESRQALSLLSGRTEPQDISRRLSLQKMTFMGMSVEVVDWFDGMLCISEPE